MSNKRKNTSVVASGRTDTKVSKRAVVRLLSLVAITAVLVFVYRVFMDTPVFAYVFWGYIAVATALALAYVIYNRGFSRKGITKDMLPDHWSDDKKESFIEDGKKRLDKSKWMLMFLFAFLIVFTVDAFELFVLPTINSWLS